jgi:hypothetical protein
MNAHTAALQPPDRDLHVPPWRRAPDGQSLGHAEFANVLSALEQVHCGLL